MTAYAVFLVGAGGAIGSILRYWVGSVWGGAGRFPVATLLVNLVGSFLIVYVHHFAAGQHISPETRLFLATGVMGGFTTYSTFNYDLLMALQAGDHQTAALNLALTLVGCLVGAFIALLSLRIFS